MPGKKNIFDLYNEQNPPTETRHDDKIVERDPVAEQEKVVQKEEPKGEPKEEPKGEPKEEPKTEPKPNEAQAKESEGNKNV